MKKIRGQKVNNVKPIALLKAEKEYDKTLDAYLKNEFKNDTERKECHIKLMDLKEKIKLMQVMLMSA